MKVSFFWIISACVILVGCGEDKAAHGPGPDDGHGHGDSGESQAANPQRPSRPASKLMDVKAGEAWKTPLNLALFLIQEENGKGRDWDEVTSVVFALVGAGELEQATEVALLLPIGSGAEALKYVVKGAAEAGDVARAMKVAQWIEAPHDRAIALCQVATEQAKAGDKSAALATIRQAEKLARTGSPKEQAKTLTAVASAQLAAGEKQRAVATCDRAMKFVQSNRNGFENANSYKHLARVLVGAGELQKTKEMIQFGNNLFGRTMNASTRTAIAAIMAEEGELEAALEWVGQFPARDNQKKAEAYGDIASSLAGKGKFKEALEVLKNDKTMFSSKSRAMGDIAVEMARAGKIDEALALVPQIRGGMAKEPALRAIASAQVAAGQKKAALATLKQAEEAADKVADMFRPKREVLVDSALGLAEVGEKELAAAKLKEAAALVLKVDEKSIPNFFGKGQFLAGLLSEVRVAMAKIGDKEGAAALLKQELELAQGVKDASKKASALYTTASSLAGLGDFEQALETVRLIDDAEKRKSSMQTLATLLPTIREVGRSHINFIYITRMKKSFTPEEQAFAKQLVEAMERG